MQILGPSSSGPPYFNYEVGAGPGGEGALDGGADIEGTVFFPRGGTCGLY